MVQALKSIHPVTDKTTYSTKYILTKVCGYFNVTRQDIVSTRRGKSNIAWARQVYVYCLSIYTNLTFREIGNLIRRDRTTIIATITTVTDNCIIYSETRKQIIELETLIEDGTDN